MKSLLGIGRHWRWMAVVATVAVAAAVGVPYLYTTVITGDAPAPLAAANRSKMADQASASAGGSRVSADSGIWQVTSGSQAGYRVRETLFGQETEAVGRTSAVTGQARVDGGRLTNGRVSVDLTKVQSNHDRRDAHFHDRIMNTGTYTEATFVLTEAVDISAVGAAGASATIPAKGDLTLRGITRPVTVQLGVQRDSSNVQVRGSIPVRFAEWDIPKPSFGQVMTIDQGQIEFLLVLARP